MPYDDTIMTDNPIPPNRVKTQRLDRGWSQEELAQRAGISRTAVSAIEIGRVVPAVSAALALASALGCSVEELFAPAPKRPSPAPPEWAWPPGREPCRYWRAEVNGRVWLYPVEPSPLGVLAHDGVAQAGGGTPANDQPTPPNHTLVMAGCDPAAGLLAAEYARASGFRLLILPRSSGQSLAMLEKGQVHLAGVHYAAPDNPAANANAVRNLTNEPMRLLRLARWEAGLALAPGVSARTLADALRARLSWVGREPGSGARQCLDQLRPNQPAPRRLAYDHRGVAEAIRCGWAEAGVCLRLNAEDAALHFLPIRAEEYDLCFPQHAEPDTRVQALLRVIRSPGYRKLLGELPGYDTSETGEIEPVSSG